MIKGSIVALVTPMHADGSVDYDALAKLVDFHVERQTDAIVSVGTTGESATLDFAEHQAVVRKTVEFAAGRVPIIAGTGANSTREAIELTAAAKGAGADACLLVTPYYNKPTQEGLYQHYKVIAEAVDIEQILYNVPGRTACDMLPETIARLSTISNIIGVKEATGDLERMQQVLDLVPDDFAVYSGDDATAMDAILLGAVGDISVTANVAPQAMHDMCTAALNGDRDQAQTLNAPLLALHENLFVESNPIPVKWAVARMGLMGDGIRLPLTELAQTGQPLVRDALAAADITI